MSKAPEQFIALQQAVGQIDALMRKAEDAAKIPDRRYNEANRVRLTSRDPYGGFDHIDKEIGERARQALGRFVADERKRGEVERDQALSECAAQIEQIRATLASRIGPAVVALGVYAREIKPSPAPPETPSE